MIGFSCRGKSERDEGCLDGKLSSQSSFIAHV